MIRNRNSVRLSVCYDNVSLTKEQLALLEERDQTIGDLQFSIDERDAQLEEVWESSGNLAGLCPHWSAILVLPYSMPMGDPPYIRSEEWVGL